MAAFLAFHRMTLWKRFMIRFWPPARQRYLVELGEEIQRLINNEPIDFI